MSAASSRLILASSRRNVIVSVRSFHESTKLSARDGGGEQKTALVVGSSGVLGSAVARHLSRMNINVIGADIQEVSETAQLYDFVPLPHPSQGDASLGEVTRRLTTGVQHVLGEDGTLDAIIVASGGWEGDPPFVEDETIEDGALAYGDSIDRMMKMNLQPVVSAGYVAQHFMNPTNGGLFVVIGATAALSPTPGMMGYGLSKTACHHFVQSFGTMTGAALHTKAQRKKSLKLRKNLASLDDLTVVGILPTKIDTPTNREAEPKADFAKWTDPRDMAKEIGDWVTDEHLRPHSGSLVKVFPGADGATFQLAR